MTIQARRIVRAEHAGEPFDGAGARRLGGRWTRPGKAVTYLASTTSLALLEVLVHVEAALLREYTVIPVTIPESLIVDVDASRLPKDWRRLPAPASLLAIGDDWLGRGEAPVLRVPSAIVPEETNLIFNPEHPHAPKVVAGEPFILAVDARLRRES